MANPTISKRNFIEVAVEDTSIALSQLTPGTNGHVVQTIGGVVSSALVSDANIGNGTIAVTKMAPGTANTVLQSNGTANSFAQLANAHIAAGAAIAYSKLALGTSIVNADIAAAAAIAYSKLNLANSITTTDIVNGTLTNEDLNAAAAIAVSKLAAGTNGDVLTTTGGVPAWGTVSSGAMTQIGHAELSVAASAITFSSIPGTYKHLKIILYARTTQATQNAAVGIRFNGDSAANYDSQLIQGVGASPNAVEILGGIYAHIGALPAAAATGGTALFGIAEVTIPWYANTTKQKGAVGVSASKWSTGASGLAASQRAGFWRSSAAITSVSLVPESLNFEAGSVATLYGMN